MTIPSFFAPSIGALLALSLLLSCGGDSGKEELSPSPPVVTTVAIEPRDVPVSFEYVAQTQSSHLVNIQARVDGFLDQRVYTEGDTVKKGQVLFVMDKKPFQAQLDAAKAAVEKQEAAVVVAKKNLDRVQPLAEQNALSQKDLDDAVGTYLTRQADLAEAKARLETAELNLSYCTITSPIDGITSAALQQDGTYLNMADSQLTTVSKLSPIWVNFSLSENEIQSYRDQIAKGTLRDPKGDRFLVKVIQVNGEIFPYTGQITFTEPYFNPQTGTFLIRASVDNPKGVLRPNQYVRVKVEGAIRPNAIVIPQRAVAHSSKGHFAWVVDRESLTAERRPITVGDWDGEGWFITSGLSAGDLVIVDGGQTLHGGEVVALKSESGKP